ncbi:MAG: ABC transporter permease DevC [Hyphomicrobiales bacterium]
MTALLSRLLGRIPIGWLQLTHSKSRLTVALAGVAFANVLVFTQLGISGGLNRTIDLTYQPLDADILMSASDANTLADGSPLARQRMFQALSVPGVAEAAPLYLGVVDWVREDSGTTALQVYGLPPEARNAVNPAYADQLADLRLPNTALLDRLSRGVTFAQDELPSMSEPLAAELGGVSMNIIGTFAIGAGFSADGNLLVSDQTFLRLFPRRSAGTPSHVLIRAEPGQDLAALSQSIAMAIASDSVVVRPLDQAIAEDVSYQTTERPTGLIFGFGVVMGAIVGVVIVYQVLSTDVADHLREYATFKAMGYRQRFFLGIVFEEAVIMAVLGFIPGLLISLAIYTGMSAATGLPIEMDVARALAVLVGTILACTLSGAIATRRLAQADPADLF